MHRSLEHDPDRRITDRLSKREAEVLSMVAAGLTNSEIAERLSLSVHAIKFHLAAVYRKLEVSNRTEAAITFVRGGMPADESPQKQSTEAPA